MVSITHAHDLVSNDKLILCFEEINLDGNDAYKGISPWNVGHPQPYFEAIIKKW